MSLVAEAKATIQKQAKLAVKNTSVLRLRPIPKKASAITNCMLKNHFLLVHFKSTKGLQSGFKTQGKYNQLVYNPISALPKPNCLYIITERVTTITYGNPWVK